MESSPYNLEGGDGFIAKPWKRPVRMPTGTRNMFVSVLLGRRGEEKTDRPFEIRDRAIDIQVDSSSPVGAQGQQFSQQI